MESEPRLLQVGDVIRAKHNDTLLFPIQETGSGRECTYLHLNLDDIAVVVAIEPRVDGTRIAFLTLHGLGWDRWATADCLRVSINVFLRFDLVL